MSLPGVLGELTPDPISVLLGTGFVRFASPTGMNGLAKVHGERLDILALDATAPGTGQLRAFIDQAKREFDTICVWHVWNPLLDGILQRFGFRACVEIDRDIGEPLEGYRFDSGRSPEARSDTA